MGLSGGGALITKTLNVSLSNTFDIGSATKYLRTLHSRQVKVYSPGGTAIGILEARSDSNIYLAALTTDGSDSQATFLCGGTEPTSSRGAYIEMHGNEYSGSGGTLSIAGGAVANAHVSILTNISTGNIRLRADNPSGGKGFDILGSDGSISFLPTLFKITSATSDGADNGQLSMSGGGGNGTTDRGAGLTLYGNENGGAGAFTLYTGDVVGTFGTINSKTSVRFGLSGGSNNVFLDGTQFLFTPSSGDTYTLGSNTSDGSDNKILGLCGGASSSAARGAYILLRGNEATSGGFLDIVAGSAASSKLRLYGGEDTTNSIEVTTGNGGGSDITAWAFKAGGDFASLVAGVGLRIKEGSNARMGVATLVGGTVTVSNTSITANTRIIVARTTTGGTAGHLSTTKIASTSFTINSSSGTDTSSVAWLLIEPS